MEERESHDAPWRQKPPAPVMRPAPLCGCCVAGFAWSVRPRLGEAAFSGAASEAVDDSTLSYLLQQLMREREEEEEDDEE